MRGKFILSSLFMFLAVFLLFGCTMGTTQDLSTGQKTNYKGLSFEETFLSVDGIRLTNNEVNMGEVLKINFGGIEGFKVDSNNLVYPGMSMKVTSTQGEEILFGENLLENYTQNGLNPLFSKSLSSNLTIGNPMKVGESYKINIQIWDELGESQIDSELTILIVE